MQAPSDSGLIPAQDAQRFHIQPILSANAELADSLRKTWAERKPHEAKEHLKNKDVTVTNQSDKDKQANLPPTRRAPASALPCPMPLALKLVVLSISCCSQLPKLLSMNQEVANAYKNTQVVHDHVSELKP